jgi:ADP-heptose:LPS heptosyltransferase
VLKSSLVKLADRTLSAVFSRRYGSISLAECRNFLLQQHHKALGPAVFATAFVRALHGSVPGARIVVAASGSSLGTLAGNPYMERLLPMPDPRRQFRAGVAGLRAARLFDGEPFVSLHNIGSARLEFRAAAMLAGARDMLWFDMRGDGRKSLKYDDKLSRIGNDLRLIELLGRGPELTRALEGHPEMHEPCLYPVERDFAAADALLREQGVTPERPIAVFVTQSRPEPLRGWSGNGFHEVAAWLHREHGMQIVFTGTSAETKAIEDLRAPLGFGTASLAGRTTIPELAAVFASADAGLAVDTGAMHVARGVNLPLVVIAAPAAAAIEWLPIGNPRARVVYSPYIPPKCGYEVPGELSVAEVQQNLRDLLERYPPGIRQQAWAGWSGRQAG